MVARIKMRLKVFFLFEQEFENPVSRQSFLDSSWSGTKWIIINLIFYCYAIEMDLKKSKVSKNSFAVQTTLLPFQENSKFYLFFNSRRIAIFPFCLHTQDGIWVG